jgi:outer membrane lipoprotein-sorting protein
MKKIIIVLLSFLLTHEFVHGFSGGGSATDSPEKEFFLALSEHSKRVSTVSGSFIQKKFITILKDSVESRGLFYYRRKGNMRFDYTKPKELSIIITPVKLWIIYAGKSNSFSLESQKGLSDLAAVMEACIGGDIKSVPVGYSVSYSFAGNKHKIEIVPKSGNSQSPYTKIEMLINSSDYFLEQLTMWERSKDHTIYRFSDATLNASVSPLMFQL